MAINAEQTFSLDLSTFGGEVTDVAPGNLPAGSSPSCADMFFSAQYTATRPAFQHALTSSLSPGHDIISHLDFPHPTGQTDNVILYDDGSLWTRNVQTGDTNQIATVSSGTRFKAVAAFDKFFMAFRSLSLTSPFTSAQYAGGDVPRYINGLGNVRRVTSDAPGGGFSVQGVNIGPEDLVSPGQFQTGPPVTSIVLTDPQTVVVNNPHSGPQTITYYTAAQVTLQAPGQALSVGQVVQLFNIAWSKPGGPQWANGVTVKSVTSNTVFKVNIAHVTQSNSATSGSFAYSTTGGGNASPFFVVQSGVVQSVQPTLVTNFSFNKPISGGNTILVACTAYHESTPPVISDNRSNTYSVVTSVAYANYTIYIFIASDAAAGATTVSMTIAGGQFPDAFSSMNVHELAGIITASPVDQSATNSGLQGSPTFNTGSVTTTNAADALFTYALSITNPSFQPTGYTQATDNTFPVGSDTVEVSTAYETLSATGTISPTWGCTGGNFNGLGITVALKIQPAYFANIIQTTRGSVQNGGTNSQTLTITFPKNVTAGNSIILSIGSFDHLGSGSPDPVPTTTDNQGNGYSTVASSTQSGQEDTSSILLANNLASTGPLTITMHFASHQFNSYICAVAAEVAGIVNASPVDTTAVNYQSSGTSYDSGTITTTNANDLVVSFVHNLAAAGTIPTSPAGYVTISSQVVPQPNGLNGSDPVLAMAVKTRTTTGNESPAWTMGHMNGGGGTIALKLQQGSSTSQAGSETLVRYNNIVTAFLAATSPGNPTLIQPGWFVNLVDTEATDTAALPDGSVPFVGNELFQAIYPSSTGGSTVPTLLTGTVCNFYPYDHKNGGAFNYDYPGDGFNEVLPAAVATYILKDNESLLFNPGTHDCGGIYLLPGTSGNLEDIHPMQVFGVNSSGSWDGKTSVIWSGAGENNWCMSVTGSIVFPTAGSYTFRILNDDGAQMGFEDGVTPVSQTPGYFNPQPHTKTALNGYPLCFAQNASTNFGHVCIYDTQVTVHVDVPGTYKFEIDYVNWETDQVLGVVASNGHGGFTPLQPTTGPGTATIKGDGLGNIHVTLPNAVEALPIGSWLYLFVNSPAPTFITDWAISSNGTALITVPKSTFTVGTEILLNGFTSVKNPEPTGWNGQTVTITAVNGDQYQFAWSGTAGSGTTTSGTATPQSGNYPSGWVQVTQVPSTTEFVYFAQGVTDTQKAFGVVYDYFGSLNTQQSLTNNGITNSQQSNSGVVQGFQVLSVDTSSTPNSITWYQAGFNDTYTGTHLLQVQPETQMAGGPRSFMVFFINEDGGSTPGSYPLNLQLNGGSEFAQVILPIGPPGTVARGTAWTPAYGSQFFALRPGNVPAAAGNAPVISTGTIIYDNTTISTIIDFSDQALVSGINVGPVTPEDSAALTDDFGDLTSTIVLPPCLGVTEFNQQLIWWGELNNLPNHSMINMGFDGGYDGTLTIGSSANVLGWDDQTGYNGQAPDQSGYLINSASGLGFSYAMPIGSATTLTFAIYSPSVGQIATATFPVSGFTTTSQWYSAAFSATMPAAIPTDTIFYLSLNGGQAMISQAAFQNYYGVPILLPSRSYVIRFQGLKTTGGGAYIALDELELIDARQPVLNKQLRVSYPDNEFGYDNENGFTVGLDTSDFISACFLQRSFLYALTEGQGELHTVQANGQVPAEWNTALFAKECGCSGPDAVTTGQSTAWWMGRHGWHAFEGQSPKKISQPIAQHIERTNWNAAVNSCMAYDSVERVLWGSFPTGAAINPNFTMTMNSRLADAAYNIPDPVHVSSYTGRLLTTDLSMKFCKVSVPINSVQMSTQNTIVGGMGADHAYAKVMTFGGGSPDGSTHYGQLYTQDFYLYPPVTPYAATWNCVDADYGTIPWHYQTYFFYAHDTEQQNMLSLYRKLFAYFSVHVMGVGYLNVAPYVDTMSNLWPAMAPAKMATTNTTFVDPTRDWNIGLNVTGNRMSLKFSGTPTTIAQGGDNQSSAMLLTHLIVSARKELVFPVDGSFGGF